MIKLIRNKLVHRIGLAKGEKIRLVNNDAEYQRLLFQKLDEELAELKVEIQVDYPNYGKCLEEAADLVEVISTILARMIGSGGEIKNLLQQVEIKRARNGGFDAGVVLVTQEKKR